jgi:hypothetical protein
MWSLGCVLAELYIGRPLFRVRSSSELFVNMQQVLGPLPAGVFSSSKFYSKYVVDPSFEVACFSRDDAKLLYELLSYIVLITDFCSEIIVVVMR